LRPFMDKKSHDGPDSAGFPACKPPVAEDTWLSDYLLLFHGTKSNFCG
jgi:hypothetical protein